MIAAETIGTGRLELVPMRIEHADEMATVLADPTMYTFIGGGPDTVSALTERYGRLVAGSPDPHATWLNWVIRSRADDCLVGTVQATVTDDVAEIAWMVGTAWQGRGFATEAARALVEWLDERPVSVIVAHVHPDHQASAAVAAAVGLVPTGERQDGEVRWRRDQPKLDSHR